MSEEIKNLVLFQNIVVFLSIGSGVLVFLFFLFLKQSKALVKLKWSILFFVFSGFFIDILLVFYPGENTKNINEFYISFYNIYTFTVGLFLLLIFRQLKISHFLKKVSTVVFGSFIAILCSASFYNRSLSFDNTNYSVVLKFIIIIFVLYYFFRKFNYVEIIPITKEYTFWFFTALFIYFGMPLVIVVTKNFLGNVEPVAFGYLWQIMNFSTVLFHLLIAKMLWIMRTE